MDSPKAKLDATRTVGVVASLGVQTQAYEISSPEANHYVGAIACKIGYGGALPIPESPPVTSAFMSPGKRWHCPALRDLSLRATDEGKDLVLDSALQCFHSSKSDKAHKPG